MFNPLTNSATIPALLTTPTTRLRLLARQSNQTLTRPKTHTHTSPILIIQYLQQISNPSQQAACSRSSSKAHHAPRDELGDVSEIFCVCIYACQLCAVLGVNVLTEERAA